MKPFAFALSTSAIASASLVATLATCAVYVPLPSMSDEAYTCGDQQLARGLRACVDPRSANRRCRGRVPR